MTLARRQFLHLTAGAAAISAVPRIARAQTYPTRPVRIIVGFSPGGATDVTARLIGQRLSERLGQQFVIENRPGANTNIATEAVVRAQPDGYTLLFVVTANVVNGALNDKLNFAFARDIVPIAGLTRTPYVFVVSPSFAVKSIPALIAYAKANPGKLNVGASSPALQAAIALFKTMAGVNMLYVPYRGEAPGLTDLMGGQVEVFVGATAGLIDHIKAGSLRALAVTTARRSEALPAIPTVAEFVPAYEAGAFYGVGAPKGTPAEIIDRLNREINASLADPKMKARFADLGSTVLPLSPADFGKLIADETEKWAKVVRAANIGPQ